ncbi:Uncharacterised protein [uncultured Clostridium sp.]|jgi:hypothetical protein|nr:hypothetical protein [Mediterraneibacter massiliensis]SCH14350.1 Uncharacterised protein [uncultured Clostridium sp.]
MPEFKQFNLSSMIEQLGEERTKRILSSFVCPLNEDVQEFCQKKAIEFSKRGFAQTYLVYWQEGNEKEFIGYYTIAMKHFTVSKKDLSNKIFSRVKQHGTYDNSTGAYIISAPLIAQLGKNFDKGNDTLISGSEILQMAIDRIRNIQKEIGGKFLYLECEEKDKLLQFYEKNNFVSFGKRKLDKDETNLEGTCLIQLLQYWEN